MRMSMGRTHWKYGLSLGENFRPLPRLASARYLSKPQPHFVTQNSRYTSEPIGRRRLLTMKSSLSRMSRPPMTCTSLQIL